MHGETDGRLGAVRPASVAMSLDALPPSPAELSLRCADDDHARHLSVLIKNFSALAPLADAEVELLRELAADARYHPPHRKLGMVGTPAPAPRIIVAGWACRYCALADGRRQIISLRLPGDLLWPLPSEPYVQSPYAVAALTELETVSAQPLAETAGPVHSGLAHAARLMAHLDDALLCDQVVRLGQQNACERLAHLALELRERLGRVGLADGERFAMPLTQDVLGDLLGLSVVHVNRTVQLLRRDRLLDVRGGVMTLLDPERLQTLAGWVPPSVLPAPRFR